MTISACKSDSQLLNHWHSLVVSPWKIHPRNLTCRAWKMMVGRQASWWLNQPIWKICSSNWKSSPSRDKNKNTWNRNLSQAFPFGFRPIFQGEIPAETLVYMFDSMKVNFFRSQAVKYSHSILFRPKKKLSSTIKNQKKWLSCCCSKNDFAETLGTFSVAP